jgi:hypothetical protein
MLQKWEQAPKWEQRGRKNVYLGLKSSLSLSGFPIDTVPRTYFLVSPTHATFIPLISPRPCPDLAKSTNYEALCITFQ